MWFKGHKIEVFVRHCHFSDVSAHKKRFSNFSREKCFQNLLETTDSRANITILLDTHHPMRGDHFVKKQTKYPILEIKEGTEGGSFICLLNHIETLSLKPDTILYFLEDDYLHRQGWIDVLLEGFSLPKSDYITLYDHRDKYSHYPDLKSELFHTPSCHWRTTPSTTNTYAMRWKTLKEHMAIHREFSFNRKISEDHAKFLKLQSIGATLLSSIPGWSTHAEPDFASPCIDWEEILNY
jgi:hypothetical protein